MLNYKKLVALFVIVTFSVIIVMSGYVYYHWGKSTDQPEEDILSNVYIGQVNINQSYTKIIFPHHINSGSDFNITILFNSNISINYVYTQTSGFCVLGWIFYFNTYIKYGTSQGKFIGSLEENIGILNITIKSPNYYYNGYISLHLVGSVPETVIY
ncbi:TVG0213580 [Thermoplasma volcanium GSS1]|uniref:TVG0213580 protein n=1 Tax=Thermoplasma volcanium (strain ATCC 51530 / DSM 4299 / JCM 9571 / NBRC 15438 / GSS1) TaxID=273116 RepID=Q97C95_THEVO|nr:TVG0213580 [Thermoplasma volcanium GSS1]